MDGWMCLRSGDLRSIQGHTLNVVEVEGARRSGVRVILLGKDCTTARGQDVVCGLGLLARGLGFGFRLSDAKHDIRESLWVGTSLTNPPL